MRLPAGRLIYVNRGLLAYQITRRSWLKKRLMKLVISLNDIIRDEKLRRSPPKSPLCLPISNRIG